MSLELGLIIIFFIILVVISNRDHEKLEKLEERIDELVDSLEEGANGLRKKTGDWEPWMSSDSDED